LWAQGYAPATREDCRVTTEAPAPPFEPPSEELRGPRRARRLILLLVPAILFVALFAVYLFKDAGKPVVGSTAPNFEAPFLDEPGRFELASLRGKPVLLNFWASWCPPCKDEAPLLEDAYARYGDDVEFVGIDIRDARDDALEFVERYGVSYPQVRDEALAVYTQYGLTGQPVSFFIDQDGIVVQQVQGPLNEALLYQFLDVLVGRNA
jgi:cytochrome c biogenesis protein CcmG, thiol:disulfide interchange protein DsbE